ncbi:cation transporting ATPase C-terminal domain-containing protein, partial [Microbacterium sp.]|uniref:cation transporting ATPase C-terminal domain-containing protein n=1 Tax=Microbacterium sp. TaxID=51671 RepID=UPI0025D20CC9
RSAGGLFSRYTLSNPTYWSACGAGVVIMLVIVYVPWAQTMFKTGPLSALDWGFVLLAAAIFVAFREVGRIVGKRRTLAQRSAQLMPRG